MAPRSSKNKRLFKDNHRPCIPNPLDQNIGLPKGGELFCEKIDAVCSVPTNGR